jgi:SrtB family sortase
LKKSVSFILLFAVIFISCSSDNGDSVEFDGTPREETRVTAEPYSSEQDTDNDLPDTPDDRVAVKKYHMDWYDINNDVVGFVDIEGTRIGFPVLQGDDNDFYMEHTIDGVFDDNGAITADKKNRFNGFDISDNTILFGHNTTLWNVPTFSPLSNYYTTTIHGNLEFYRNNPVAKFDTLYEQMEFKIFAVVMYNTQPEYGEVVYFWNYTDFKNADEFHEYILMIMDRSVLFTDVDIQYGDRLLSLMTCYYPAAGVDARYVVYARQIRPGESSEVDVSKATRNHHAFRFGESSGERVWDSSYLTSYSGNGNDNQPITGKEWKFNGHNS